MEAIDNPIVPLVDPLLGPPPPSTLPRVPIEPPVFHSDWHPVDNSIRFFQALRDWADVNGHGNSHGILMRIVHDLEALRALPHEAFDMPEPPAPPLVDAPVVPAPVDTLPEPAVDWRDRLPSDE